MKAKLPIRDLIFALSLLAPCIALAQAPTHEQHAPGTEKSAKTRLLEAGAELLQGEAPLSAIHQHVCGLHFYADDIKRQVIAHHYCAHPSEDMLQCVIYDSAEKNARLIGIEYIISEELFKALPEEEKRLWHSHRYEVMSGQLIAPRVPDVAEKEVMKKLVTTYGKTWHTWQVDRGDKLPLGVPKLMMSFTADGQADPKLVQQRDQALRVSTAEKRKERADIPTRDIAPGADAWQHGSAFQIRDDGTAAVAPANSPAKTNKP
jgi:hypothetical protein